MKNLTSITVLFAAVPFFVSFQFRILMYDVLRMVTKTINITVMIQSKFENLT